VKTSTPVVVFSDVPDPYAHTAVAVARSLGRIGIPVWSVHADPAAPAAQSRYTDRRLIWRDWPSDAHDRVERLLKVGRAQEERPILIPYDDESALLVDDHADELKGSFLFPERPPGLARSLADKRRMSALCTKFGVPTPTTLFPQDDHEAETFLRTVPLPVVLKGARSWIPGRRPAPMVIAQDVNEGLAAYARMDEAERRNVMLQEYIPGGSDSVWMFNGYFDVESECLVGFTGRKLRQSPPETGPASLGVCVWNPRVAETTTSLMSKLGYRGILDIGFRYDARDGQYKLLDVNPRIGSTFRLFVDPITKIDVVRALYLDLTRQSIPAVTQPEGRKWVVEPWDTRSSLWYRRDGRLSGRDWLRSLRRVEEAAWFAADDPRPFIALCGRLARSRLRKRLGGGRSGKR
jgi:D-aspartate ligase